MNIEEITPEDKKIMSKIKKELLTNEKATFRSNSLCEKKLIELSEKYNTTTQIIFDISQ